MLFEGTQLGQYHIRRLVGRGGAGNVYLADDQRLLRQVAVKVVQSEDPASETAREALRRFQREAQMIAKLNHPNILPLFDFGEAVVNGVNLAYLVMPFCPEGSLTAWLRQRTGTGALILPPHDALYIVWQAADALEYAHDQQIIHRDVKPSNFLVRSRKDTPDRPDLLLADFGVARLAQGNVNTSTTIRGTPIYMAPEQWSAHPVPATDQYALAIMTYELLTGRPPFQGTQEQVMYQHLMGQPQPPSTFSARISPNVDAAVLRALAKRPTDRYPSVSAFVYAFQQAVTEMPYSSPSTRITGSSPALPTPLPLVKNPPSNAETNISPSNIPEPKITVPAIPTPEGMESNEPHTLLPISQAETLAGTEPSQPSISPPSVSRPSRPPISEPTVIQPMAGLSPSHIRRKARLLIGLVLLLLLVSVVALSPLGKNWSPINAPNATATANASNAAMQAIQSTISAEMATANARATATARVEATAAVNANPNDRTMGHLKLQEALTGNSSSGWDENGACAFAKDGYHVVRSAQAATAQMCIAHNLNNLGDFTFQVQMSILNGSGGGPLFRVAGSTTYYFRISKDGHYALFACARTDCSRTLVSSLSSFYDPQKQPNVLAVVAKGAHIGLYVNGVLINSVDDSSSLHGQIGLAAEAGSEVVFSDAKVWTT